MNKIDEYVNRHTALASPEHCIQQVVRRAAAITHRQGFNDRARALAEAAEIATNGEITADDFEALALSNPRFELHQRVEHGGQGAEVLGITLRDDGRLGYHLVYDDGTTTLGSTGPLLGRVISEVR